MKILIYSLVILAAFVYVADSQTLVETLIKRAEGIIQMVRPDIERYMNNVTELALELEHEMKEVVQLEKELKGLPHEHVLSEKAAYEYEEQLSRYEIRLTQVLILIKIRPDGHRIGEAARDLIVSAEAVLKKLYSQGKDDLAPEIEHEMSRLNEILNDKSSSGTTLVLHIRRMQQVLQLAQTQL